MLLELLVVSQHVIEGKHRVLVAVVGTFTILVTAPRCSIGVKERSIERIAAVNGERRLESQLRHEGNQGAARCQQAVFAVAVVALALDVLQRAGNVQAIEIGVVLAGIFRVPNRSIGRRVNYGEHNATTVRARTHGTTTVAGIVGVRDIGRYGQPFAHLVFHIGTEAITPVERRLNDTVLVLVAGRKEVTQFFCSVGYRHLVVLRITRAIGFIKPVGLVGQAVGQADNADFIHQVLVLCRIQRLNLVGYLRQTILNVQGNLGLAGLTALGRNQHNTVGRTRTIDGCRRGILQNLHAFNVVGRKELQVVYRHTVHYIQRVVATVERRGTTHADRHLGTRRTVGLNDLHTCRLALQSLPGRNKRTLLQVFRRNRRHGSGYILTLHRTIANDNNFVQQLVVFLQCDFKGSRRLHLLRLIADVRYHQRSLRVNGQSEITVHVGHRTISCPFFLDTGADDGQLSIVYYEPFYCQFLGKSTQGDQHHQQQSRQSWNHPAKNPFVFHAS